MTVLFITHSLSEAVFLSSKVLVMSNRPGQIISEIEIGLPHPRTKEIMTEPEFFEHLTRVREALSLA
jgi:NitT/TauT family transport system ATP-binding protein